MGDFEAYPSRWRLALITLAASTFVIAGMWMGGAFGSVPSSRRYAEGFTFAIGWFGAAFGGLCGGIAIKRMFETGVQVQIGPRGILWATWSDRTIPWSEITDVTTWSYNRQKMIVLTLRRPDLFPGRGVAAMFAGANQKLTGGNISITLAGTDRSFEDAMSAVSRFRP